MATYEIAVRAVITVPDEYKGHPLHGAEAIAEQYAMMAKSYASIGALSSKVNSVVEIPTRES